MLVVALAPGAAGSPVRADSLGANFLWGVSTSGFQSEGDAPESNWSRYATTSDDPYGNSVDFRHRYVDDIGLAANLGIKVYRLGIEWARVQPQPGAWDESAFAFYDDVIRHIRAAGMRPMITLDHWVYPAWEIGRGGWGNPAMVDDWLTNMRRVVDRYAAYDPLWVTINEPTAYVAQEVSHGGLPPAQVPAMFDRLAQAHNLIYDYIHAAHPSAPVTTNVAYIPAAEAAIDTQFVDKVSAKLDYIGIDYYYGASLDHPPTLDPLVGTQWNAHLQPEGIYYALRFYARKFPGRPLYVVENGMPTDNGMPRPDGYDRATALRDTVYWLQRAKADGMNLIGYNYWSLTDNYEWGSYAPRFGLYTVDVRRDPTLARRPTDAVPAYRKIVDAGGVGPDYRPTVAPGVCSIIDPPTSCTEPVTIPTR
ncbi:family 1 glycosylhydrolase [Antrihabitans cavernicola]|uniref:Glycoside hydrolase family 1 protein n=1 Tax=Antrihabitans cavernicola TaxID=2495913 RepID=A0A5A7SCQ4_9NOCA|nr:family 1 glycosylhydrolase [Spelaeibacter cavernicola]KAA0023676.1 glycoside hydrolase family 1 protein [Spelaeibacter cavernicola]